MNEIGAQPNRISKHTKIKGDIVSEADFRIDGKLDGNVKTTGKVVIGKDGYIHGKVECVNALNDAKQLRGCVFCGYPLPDSLSVLLPRIKGNAVKLVQRCFGYGHGAWGAGEKEVNVIHIAGCVD